MNGSVFFDHRKAVQAVNYFARNSRGKRINKMKVLKLLWAADRYHLRKYGRPVTGDSYVAMKYGPVGSTIRDILEKNSFLEGGSELAYASQYVDEETYDIKSLAEVDTNVLSKTDISALEYVAKTLGKLNQWDLKDLAHKYPEWSRFEGDLISGRIAVANMNYLDFFQNPTIKESDLFEEEDKQLKLNREIFEDSHAFGDQWI